MSVFESWTPDHAAPLWTAEPARKVLTLHDREWERAASLGPYLGCQDCGGTGTIEPEWGDPVLDNPHACPCTVRTILLGEERPCERCWGSKYLPGYYPCPACHGTGIVHTPTDPFEGEGLPVVDEEGREIELYADVYQPAMMRFADLRTRFFALMDRLPHRWIVVLDGLDDAKAKRIRESLLSPPPAKYLANPQQHSEMTSAELDELLYRPNLTLCVPAGHDTEALRGLADLCRLGVWDGAKVTLWEGAEA